MLTLSEVMSKKVITSSETRGVREAARLMHKNGIGSIVVLRSGKVAGIVTERDVLRVVAQGKNPGSVKIKTVMTTPVIVGDEKTNLQDAIKIMVLNNIKKLPILRGHRLVGIVTTTDFARVEPLFHDMFEKALAHASKPAQEKFRKFVVGRDAPGSMYA